MENCAVISDKFADIWRRIWCARKIQWYKKTGVTNHTALAIPQRTIYQVTWTTDKTGRQAYSANIFKLLKAKNIYLL